ncbi:MAG: CHASE2 domain-containing protein [Betaproteobacteria bacterium AqS2]|uniref:CHASE2 domain-containing protein n=1 Tax=Candidatus Amphirhobacter heronislandensis TaxID=1732024 RepID=A0A930XXX8_9GAMM|nr:CHASE2 domain-containing protein [Betaproteobacteria bacterium AqS2]
MTRIIANLIVSLVACALLATYEGKPDFLSIQSVEELERFAYDLRMLNSIEGVQPQPEKEVVIIDIDRRSVEQIESWPWRRDRLSELLRILHDDHEVQLVVFPEVLQETGDQTRAVISELKEKFSYDGAIQKAIEQIEPEYDFDQKLRDTVDGRPMILGYMVDESERQSGQLPRIVELFDIASGRNKGFKPSELREYIQDWSSYSGYFASNDFFHDRAVDSGIVHLSPDVDGIIREYEVIAELNSQLYLSLPAVVERYAGNLLNPNQVYAYAVPSGVAAGVHSIGTRESQTPITSTGRVMLGYQGGVGPRSSVFPYYSAYDLMNGAVEEGALVDKIAFIGSSSQEVNDLWNTPVGARVPGIELHALAYRNLRDQSSLSRPHSALVVENVLLLLLALALSVLYVRLRVVMTVGVSLGLAAVVIYLNYNVMWLGSQDVYRLVPFIALIVALMATVHPAGAGQGGQRLEERLLDGRREPRHDDPVLGRARLHDDLRKPRPERPHQADEPDAVGDVLRDPPQPGDDRQVHRRRGDGVLERAARRPEPRAERRARRDGHAAGDGQAVEGAGGEGHAGAQDGHRPQHRHRLRRQHGLEHPPVVHGDGRHGEPGVAARGHHQAVRRGHHRRRAHLRDDQGALPVPAGGRGAGQGQEPGGDDLQPDRRRARRDREHAAAARTVERVLGDVQPPRLRQHGGDHRAAQGDFPRRRAAGHLPAQGAASARGAAAGRLGSRHQFRHQMKKGDTRG